MLALANTTLSAFVRLTFLSCIDTDGQLMLQLGGASIGCWYVASHTLFSDGIYSPQTGSSYTRALVHAVWFMRATDRYHAALKSLRITL